DRLSARLACLRSLLCRANDRKVARGPHGERKRTSKENWNNPRKWNAGAHAFKREHGHRPRVFFVPHLPTYSIIRLRDKYGKGGSLLAAKNMSRIQSNCHSQHRVTTY